ncbi:MAG TPA: T9SS type A sorting domain-containing protein, partial [Puia sp.]|nr:T9SS type A sorting domain-containing protein [Puia sp.]
DRYYRLKIIDKDVQYAYSKILFIASGQTATFSVTPTLVTGSINVSLPPSGTTSVSIYNISGHLIKTFTTGSEVFNMDVSRLTRGEYFLQVLQGKNAYITKFLKQ